MRTFFRKKIRFALKQAKRRYPLWQNKIREKALLWVVPWLEKLKNRRQSLNSREKYSVLAGMALTIILLFYALIWSPLNSHLDNLRQQIRREKKTAAWMHAIDKQLHALESKQSQTPAKLLSQRINLVQEDLRQAPLSKNLTQLTQNSIDEIHCVFDHVNFDTLITWLLGFSQQHDLTIKQASLRRLNKIGLVQAEFVLQVRH